MRYLLLLLVCVMLLSCENNQITSAFTEIESLMNERPDSSLLLLSKIDKKELIRKKDNAKYALLLSEALDKNYIDLTTDSIINVAISYYERKGSNKDRASAFYYLGRVHENAGNIDPAIEAYVKALEFADEHNLRGFIYSSIGLLYTYQLSNEDALRMYSLASEEFRKINDLKNLSYTLGSEGKINLWLGKKEPALAKCNEALAIAKELCDTSYILTLSHYIGNNMAFEYKEFKEAYDFLFSIYNRYTFGEVPVSAYPLLGYIHLNLHDIEQAEYYILNSIKDENDSRSLIGYFNLMTSLYEQKGKYSEALKYNKTAFTLQDSVFNAEKDIFIRVLEKKYKTEILQGRYDLLLAKHQYHVIISVLIIVLLILGSILISRKIRKEKRIKEKELEEYSTFLDKIQKDYDSITKDYNSLFENFNKQDKKMNNFREALSDRLYSVKELIEIAGNSGDNTELFIKKFKKYIQFEAGKTKRLFTNLQDLVNLQYNGIVDFIAKKFPALNDEDLNLCCLIYLKIPVNGILLMYNYTNMDSFYNRRYRLRKKLGLTSDINLDDYLEQLLNELPANSF